MFIVSEDYTELLDGSGPVIVEIPSLYSFCTEGSVTIEADELASTEFYNLQRRVWTAKRRKKSLRFLEKSDQGRSFNLSHHPGVNEESGGTIPIGEAYEVSIVTSDSDRRHTVTLQRICLVRNAWKMQQIARDTAVAGLDESLVPEMALVLELEGRKESGIGTPTYRFQHVVASYPDRETIAVITNHPADSSVSVNLFVSIMAPCGEYSTQFHTDSELSTEQEGRSVIVIDGSSDYGSITPEGYRLD